MRCIYTEHVGRVGMIIMERNVINGESYQYVTRSYGCGVRRKGYDAVEINKHTIICSNYWKWTKSAAMVKIVSYTS